MTATRLTLTCLVLLVGGITHAQLTIVASLAPYGSLIEQLVDGQSEVVVLLPPGASPHTFEPTPRTATMLAGADLIVLNGSVDEWLHDLVAAAGSGAAVLEVFEVLDAELVALDDRHQEDTKEPAVEDGHADEHDDDHAGEPADEERDDAHAHDGQNPHVWLDPILMAKVATVLGAELAALDPSNGELYRSRAAGLSKDLLRLDRELRETLRPVAGAPFIPFHDAWPYFARRYDLDLILEIEPFPGREPSPRYLVEAVRAIRTSGAPAIFSEVGLSDRPGRVLAAEAGVELFLLDPLGTAGEQYQDLLRRNAEVLVTALKSWQR